MNDNNEVACSSDVTVPQRQIVIDVAQISNNIRQDSNRRKRGRRRSGNKNKRQQVEVTTQTSEFPNYPLEMQPVLREALHYGRRTHQLALLHVASKLDDVISSVTEGSDPMSIKAMLQNLTFMLRNPAAHDSDED